jgi:predicted lipoprotein with Yx(FWY)xxD motif
VSSDRRTTVLGGGALAVIAALVASGCAPVGADQRGNGNRPANKPAVVGAPAPEDVPEEAPDKKAPKSKGFVTTSLTAKTLPRMGDAVADSKGWLLYMFTNDKAGKSTCYDECQKKWPPVLQEDDVELSGIDESKISTVTRKDGTKQLKLGKWPLYRWYKDKPGKWRGQGMGDVWFIVTPTGTASKSCLPARQTNPDPPEQDTGDDGDEDQGGSTGGGGYGY